LEHTAEIHTFISFLFKNTNVTDTIFFLIIINSNTHKKLYIIKFYWYPAFTQFLKFADGCAV